MLALRGRLGFVTASPIVPHHVHALGATHVRGIGGHLGSPLSHALTSALEVRSRWGGQTANKDGPSCQRGYPWGSPTTQGG